MIGTITVVNTIDCIYKVKVKIRARKNSVFHFRVQKINWESPKVGFPLRKVFFPLQLSIW